MSFEEKNKRIEEIINLLKSEDVELATSIKLFEEASNLTKSCLEELNAGSGKIKIISSELEELDFKDI